MPHRESLADSETMDNMSDLDPQSFEVKGQWQKAQVKKPTALQLPSQEQNNQAPLQQYATGSITPPISPQGWPTSPTNDRFYDYRRAMHDFDGEKWNLSAAGEAADILSVEQGDLVLIHWARSDGWAQASVLRTNAIGWIPINFFEGYDEERMRHLMNALTNAWEFLSGQDTDTAIFTRQDYARGMVAGVRSLLQRSGCVNRESPLLQGNVGLRRLRKALLNGLQTFFNAAKLLKDQCEQEPGKRPTGDALCSHLDDILAKAFKVVIRASKFLDLWMQDVKLAARSTTTQQQGKHDQQSKSGQQAPIQPMQPLQVQQASPKQGGVDPLQLAAAVGPLAAGTHPTPSSRPHTLDTAVTTHSDAPITSIKVPAACSSISANSITDSKFPISPPDSFGFSDVVLDHERNQQHPQSASTAEVSLSIYSGSHAGAGGNIQTQDEVASNTNTRLPSSNSAARIIDTPETLQSAPRSRVPSRPEGHDLMPSAVTGIATPLTRPREIFTFPPRGQSLAHSSSCHNPRASTSHRISRSLKSSEPTQNVRAYQKLCDAHDNFIGAFGVFVGLQMHTTGASIMDVLETTRRSCMACHSLLSVVEQISERDRTGLGDSEAALHGRLQSLVNATTRVFQLSQSSDGPDVCLPDQANELVDVATLCVRAAGEVVLKSKSVIERIGDFDLAEREEAVGLGIGGQDEVPTHAGKQQTRQPKLRSQISDRRHHMSISIDKPLPGLPSSQNSTPVIPQPPHAPPSPPTPPLLRPSSPPRLSSSHSEGRASSAATLRPDKGSSVRAHSVPRLPEATGTSDATISQDASTSSMSLRLDVNIPKTSFIDMSDSSSNNESPQYRQGPYASNSADTNDSRFCFSDHRRSQSTALTQPSTRAGTPDLNEKAKNLAQISFGSLSDDSDLTEEKILTQTYAHELIFNRDGQVVGGSLPALVEQLTIHDSTPDPTFVNSFHLTFRLFTTPADLAQALVDRYDGAGDSEDVAKPIRLRVHNAFKVWLESFWRPDVDREALSLIESFAQNKLERELPRAAGRLLELVDQVQNIPRHTIPTPRLTTSSFGRSRAVSVARPQLEAPTPSSNMGRKEFNLLKHWKKDWQPCTILDFDSMEIARQLTMMQAQVFCAIQPHELMAQEWTKKERSQAVNVKAMILLATNLTNFVGDTILNLDIKRRAVIIKQWVKIAEKCRDLGNYDGLMAIIASLNSSVIARLRKTWDLVSEKTLSKLDHMKALMDCARNYAILRQRLQDHPPPCIPFIGQYLTDLVMIDEGNRAMRELPGTATGERNSVINFDKHMKTAKIIADVQQFQAPYNLIAVPELQEWIHCQLEASRDTDQKLLEDYYERSCRLEPRPNQGAVGTGVFPHVQRGRTGSGENAPESAVGPGASEDVPKGSIKERLDQWASTRLTYNKEKSTT